MQAWDTFSLSSRWTFTCAPCACCQWTESSAGGDSLLLPSLTPTSTDTLLNWSGYMYYTSNASSTVTTAQRLLPWEFTALNQRRYNVQHDSVLASLASYPGRVGGERRLPPTHTAWAWGYCKPSQDGWEASPYHCLYAGSDMLLQWYKLGPYEIATMVWTVYLYSLQ